MQIEASYNYFLSLKYIFMHYIERRAMQDFHNLSEKFAAETNPAVRIVAQYKN